MVCKLLFFDYTNEEKAFFDTNQLDNFDITFFQSCLNDENVDNLSRIELDETVILSIREASNLSPYVISRFKNLLLISVRSYDYTNVDVIYCFHNNIALINVESANNISTEYLLRESFKGMTNFLCGGKEYRVV